MDPCAASILCSSILKIPKLALSKLLCLSGAAQYHTKALTCVEEQSDPGSVMVMSQVWTSFTPTSVSTPGAMQSWPDWVRSSSPLTCLWQRPVDAQAKSIRNGQGHSDAISDHVILATSGTGSSWARSTDSLKQWGPQDFYMELVSAVWPVQ